ncbi:MAG: hypothetical protein ACLFS7_02745 [Desulfosudaceae bacterium]
MYRYLLEKYILIRPVVSLPRAMATRQANNRMRVTPVTRLKRPALRAGNAGLFLVFVLLLGVASPGQAGMDVMTNEELSRAEGGTLAELGIYEDDYYNSGDRLNSDDSEAADVTVVRLASDVYIENYGELGALKMGNYPRSAEELGDMASMDSNYTMVYGPQDRENPRGNGSVDGYFRGTGGDDPYRVIDGNNNRVDRVHDRYAGSGSDEIYLGDSTNLSSDPPAAGFGSDQASSDAPESQWDVNWEAMQIGLDEEHPMRMYGVILRAEFSGWGTDQQQLRRFVLGSNNLYGYSHARPLSTSGWLASDMAKLSDALHENVKPTMFQLQRDPIMDQHWSLSSFDMNPDDSTSDGSFRQFWFNTDMSQVTTNPEDPQDGAYQDKNHGFFLAVDVTDRRFSGWNIIGGCNEYNKWPNFEQHDDQYFENRYH